MGLLANLCYSRELRNAYPGWVTIVPCPHLARHPSAIEMTTLPLLHEGLASLIRCERDQVRNLDPRRACHSSAAIGHGRRSMPILLSPTPKRPKWRYELCRPIRYVLSSVDLRQIGQLRWRRSRGPWGFTYLGVTSVPGSIAHDRLEIRHLLEGLRIFFIARSLGLRPRDEAGSGTSIPSRTWSDDADLSRV